MWVCYECELSQVAFELEADWKRHMRCTHGDVCNDKQLNILAKLGPRKMLQPIGCPLCRRSENIDPEFDDHIASHVHGWALRAIPWTATFNSRPSHTLEVLSQREYLTAEEGGLASLNQPEQRAQGGGTSLTDYLTKLKEAETHRSRDQYTNDWISSLGTDEPTTSSLPDDSKIQLEKANYMVGWMVTLPIEEVAGIRIFDEEHDQPCDFKQQETDYNLYAWGKISDHNVVIGALSMEDTGRTHATNATNMLAAFPQIRMCLMLGVGGGIPGPQHNTDIRLGDVIVGQPWGTHGGVVQWDHRKIKGSPAVEGNIFLNTPPRTVLTALARLQRKHERAQSAVPAILATMLGTYPGMGKEKIAYTYPGEENDKLFKSTYPHTFGMTCVDCDISQTVSREKRNSSDPVIHYGLIASSEMLVQDPTVRDRISSIVGMECLCCEMGAAAVMNSLPCLVIQGISDYADSHSNNVWKKYAAAAATAYAKEFMMAVAKEELEREDTALDLMKPKSYDKWSSDIQTWLSPPDPSTNLNSALQRRQPGSGKWLLQNSHFLRWKTAQSSFLWLHGKPGCGKTILTSTVIEHIRNVVSEPAVLAYFYFDSRDSAKTSFTNMTASLANQLYSKCQSSRGHLDELYSSCGTGRQILSNSTLSLTLEKMIEKAGKVSIVLDALDECLSKDYECLLEWILRLQSGKAAVSLLVTSRTEQHIQSSITKWAKLSEIITIISSLIDNDITKYIQTRLRGHIELSRWPAVQMGIESALRQKADGMFLWVAYQLDELQKCQSVPMMRKLLESFPIGLADTYARTLENIPCDDLPKTIRILQFVAYSEIPLRLEEVVDAVAVDTKRVPHFEKRNRRQIPIEVLRYCSSLVTVSMKQHLGGEYMQLQFTHFSVREWLMSSRLDPELGAAFHEGAARLVIATVCALYLLELKHDNATAGNVDALYPFAQYSAKNWAAHAAIAESQYQTVNEATMQLLDCRDSYERCYRLFQPDTKTWVARDGIPPPLYYASFTGLFYAAERILLNPHVDINAQGYVGTCLAAASAEGHDKIVQLLVENGADVNMQSGCGYYGTALAAASEKGNGEIVQRLLGSGANINAQGGGYYSGTALIAASAKGYHNIVQMLLDQGADVNAEGDGDYFSALYAASSEGQYDIVQLLVERGAEVNALSMCSFYSTARAAAEANGYEKIGQLLAKAA